VGTLKHCVRLAAASFLGSSGRPAASWHDVGASMNPYRRCIIQTPIAYQGFLSSDCWAAHPRSTLARRVSVPAYDRSALVASELHVVVRGFGYVDQLAHVDDFARRCISDDDEKFHSTLDQLGQLAYHACGESLISICGLNWLVAWSPTRLPSSIAGRAFYEGYLPQLSGTFFGQSSGDLRGTGAVRSGSRTPVDC
jgi:hypothetical protein